MNDITEQEYQLALAEFLAKNEVTKIATGHSSPQAGTSGWGHGRKPAAEAKPAKAPAKPKKVKK
jgi:hypothetical protein